MNFLILIISILIYATFGFQALLYILLALLVSFISAKLLSKENKYRKEILCGVIIANIIPLIIAKLQGYLLTNVVSIFGISYFTLQIISYLIDVYREKYKAETNLLYYAIYIMYIPHLFIGPIEKYDTMKEQITKHKKITLKNFLNGGMRILWGLLKKLIIVGRTSIIISRISGSPEIYNGAYALLAMFLYSIELYSDFSGGIDIVLGISKILGIDLSENFNSPFQAQTIQEFWRRWHITLSTWLRDYVYIPLGGNRRGKVRKFINVIITFAVSGLWHGVNYILWGIIHGIFVSFGDIYKTKSKIFNQIVNFIIVSFLWAFFIWGTSQEALNMMLTVFTNFNIVEVIKNILNLGLTNIDWIILIMSTIILFIFDAKKEKFLNKKISNNGKLAIICTMILIVLIFGIYGIGFEVSEFIYSKF